MRRIRILYVVESMEVAGAEQVVLALVSRLNRNRFEPVVCCLTEKGAMAPALEAQGVPVVPLHKDPRLDLPVIPRLIRVIRRYRPDIVHTHSWPANAWGRMAAKLGGVPAVVATEHSVHAWKRPLHLAVDRWLARLTDRVICVSGAVREFYRLRAGIPPQKLVRIPNGVDLAAFNGALDPQATRTALHLGSETPVAVVVGRLLPEKGHRFFLESLKRVQQSVPGIVGLIVGEGPELSRLERLCGQLGLSGAVRFLGCREDVPVLLKASDVAVLPSLREGLPLVVLEAMAAAKPVVVTDVGGNREAVEDGVTGLVVPPGNPEALAEGVVKVLRNPALARRMGEAGRARVALEFSLEAMVRANEQVYEEALTDAGTCHT